MRKNTQNMLLDGCYLLLEQYIHARKKSVQLYPSLSCNRAEI